MEEKGGIEDLRLDSNWDDDQGWMRLKRAGEFEKL